ncbi:Kinesin-like protein [Phytophthora cactorum]|nr:Kinesin-like protein [Phytophthora cactorum]
MGNDFGSSGARNDRGVIPRVIESVRVRSMWRLKLSYLEVRGYKFANLDVVYDVMLVFILLLQILNEEIHDLFPKFSTDKLRQTLSVRGDGDRGIIVHGLREHVVNSADKALELLRSGALLRATAATCMNGKSSRSHAICTIAMEYREVIAVEGVRETRYSKFHLVDLAGSERVRRTNTQGARFKEGVSINLRTDEPHSNAISSLEEENRKLTEELCLAKEAKDKWKKIAENSSDEEDDNIQADPDYVSDEHRSTKRKKVNSTTSLTGDVMDEIDELLETSAASCCSCHGKCATKACACKSQSRVCSDTCLCNSENCRNRHMGDTPGGVNLHKGNADLAAPSTPTRPNAPEAFVSTGPAVGNDTAIDLMSP